MICLKGEREGVGGGVGGTGFLALKLAWRQLGQLQPTQRAIEIEGADVRMAPVHFSYAKKKQKTHWRWSGNLTSAPPVRLEGGGKVVGVEMGSG